MILVSGLGDLAMGLGGTALAFAIIVLIFMGILMPYYVYKCRHLLDDLKNKADEQITETKHTNGLLRQLLKACGHDPEG
jgi:Na+-driven multidrug efflux pump